MKYKSKTKLIIVISIIFTIFIITLVLFFKTDIFRTKRSAFLRYFEYIPTAANILNDNTFDAYNNMKQTMPYIRNAEMTIQSSSNIADSSILDKIKMAMTEKTDYKGEVSNAEITIKKDKNELANISYIKEKNVLGLYSPQVSNGYISIRNENLQTIISTFLGNDFYKYFSGEIIELKKDKIFKISKNEKNHIIECCNLLKSNVPDTAYSKENSKKIKIDDETYTTTAYTLYLEAKENANLQISILEKISQDSILMNYITSKCKLLNLNDEYTDINKLNEKIKSRINELKENYQSAQNLTITIYENKQKNIKTQIRNGENIITIENISNNQLQKSKLTINNISIEIKKENNEYYFKVQNDEELTNSIEINYNQVGSIENNNIQNMMRINLKDGIKSITYSYNDQINFTNDTGIIKSFENNKIAILNDYKEEDVKKFIKELKVKINRVYVNQGAKIGINLDPIFAVY